jgi:protein MAK16
MRVNSQCMQVIWQLVMHGHCSFRAKTKTQNFCRNEYNVTGEGCLPSS